MAQEVKAKVIRVNREIGKGDWFYATSPDLRGLLVAQPTLDDLEKAIPQAITDLLAARGLNVQVYPLTAEGDEGPHGSWVVSWVVVPDQLAKNHHRKPSPAAA